jgi:hypothetical protein
VKNNIPFNLARRICCIVSDPELRNFRLWELVETLRVIRIGIEKALSIPQEELRKTKEHDEKAKESIPYISTHNPNINDIFNEVRKTFEILRTHPATNNSFKNKQLVRSKRQPPNLKRILTKAKFSENENSCVSKCGDKKCHLCRRIIESDKLFFNSVKQMFTIKYKCHVIRNIVYM